MIRTLYMVDVLVLVPEYLGPSAMVTSAFEYIKTLSKGSPFNFTLVQYPEDDPRFDIDYQRAFQGDAVLPFQQSVNGIADREDEDLMNYEGRENQDPYDYIDSQQTFEARVHLAQRFLEEDAAEEWYEMNRPDYSFDARRTLGILLNPYSHEQGWVSGPVQEAANLALLPVHLSPENQAYTHLLLAAEMLVAPLRFLLGRLDQKTCSHEMSCGCINDQVHSEEDLGSRFEYGTLCPSCIEGVQQLTPNLDIEHYFEKGMRILREKQADIAKTSSARTPLYMELQTKMLCLSFPQIAVRIPLSAKECALYQYILEHPNGLTKDAVSSARTSLSESFERLSHADEAPSKSEVHDVIDAWHYSNDLRITVGKINAKFRKVEHLPGMKNWMITRVGDSFRIQAKS